MFSNQSPASRSPAAARGTHIRPTRVLTHDARSNDNRASRGWVLEIQRCRRAAYREQGGPISLNAQANVDSSFLMSENSCNAGNAPAKSNSPNASTQSLPIAALSDR